MTAREKFAVAARRQALRRPILAAIHRERRRLSVYIAGPVSGMPEYNRPAFEAARAHVEAIPCFRAVVPHDLYTPTAEDLKCLALVWCRAMVACWPALEAAHYVYMLPGWERSPGARREPARARELRKVVVFAVGARAG